MTTAGTRTLIGFATTLLLTGVFFAAYLTGGVLLFFPLALLVAFCFLHYPHLLFYTLLASIPWSAEVHFSNGFATDLPDEPLMLLTAFSAILLWLQGRHKDKHFHSLLFLLVAGFGWMLISTLASTHFLYSIKYVAAKGWYLLAFVAMPLLLRDDKRVIKNGAIVLFVSMCAVTVLSLYKHAVLGFSFTTVNEALKPHFRNHVNYSALLVMMVPLGVGVYQNTKNRLVRLSVFLAMLMVVTALYLSYSRGAWLALLIGMTGFWLVKRGWLFKSFLAFLTVVLLGVGWLTYKNNYLRFAPDHNTTVFHQNFSEHLAATYKGKDVSTAERLYRWVAGARMSTDNWLTGFGPTTFYPNYKPYTIPIFRTWVSNNKEKSTVHNYFLLLLIEQGVPGLLLFLALAGTMFWYAQHTYRQTADNFWKTTVAVTGAILLMQCTVNFLSDLIETDKVGSVFYLCVAVLVIAGRGTAEQMSKEYRIKKTED